MLKTGKKEYEVTVKEMKNGYKVIVKTIKVSISSNMGLGLGLGSSLRPRLYFGKPKTKLEVLDTNEILLDKEIWEEQLKKWCLACEYDEKTQEKIFKKIEVIESIR